MPDKYGNPLRAGDKVLFTGAAYSGLQEGVLKYDEDEKIKYHIIMETVYPDGRKESYTKHYTRLKGNDQYILNIAYFVRAQLDSGEIDLIQ